MVADGKNILLVEGINRDVLESIETCYNRWKDQPRDICRGILNKSIDEKCEAIFGALASRTTYKLDPDGIQQIKSPARLLKDGKGDCKSLAMFINCCLHSAGVPRHCFRFVNFDGGDQYSHVYAVAWDEQGREIVMDACEKDEDGVILMDYARPYSKKRDIFCN